MDMALDDIIKTNSKPTTSTRRFRGSGAPRGSSRGRGSGAFYRPRGGGRRSAPYGIKRGNVLDRLDDNVIDFNVNEEDDAVWEHDLFDEDEEEVLDRLEMKEEFTSSNNNNGEVPKAIETGTRIQIDNLEFSVTKENLQEIFGRIGEVKKVIINYDQSGRSNGSATVTFCNKSDALACLKKYNGIEIDGKAIHLTLLGSNLPTRPRGGRGGLSATQRVTRRMGLTSHRVRGVKGKGRITFRR